MPARPRPPSASCSTPASSHKIGEVHDGAATMDWMEQEQERGITITSAATTCFWKGMDGSLPGTPHQHHRHPRPRGLHHRGGALAARARRRVHRVCARSAACSRSPRPSGARPTSTACRASPSSTRWTAPAPTSSRSYDQMKERLRRNPVPMQMPIGAEENFKGVVDLVKMKAIYWDDATQGMKFEVRRDPGRAAGSCQGMAREDDRGRRRGQRRADGQVPRAATSSRPRRSSRACASAPSRARSCRCCAARRSRTRACRRCSTR